MKSSYIVNTLLAAAASEIAFALAEPADSAASGGNCISITFTSDDPNYNYFFNGGWGTGTGKISSLTGAKSLCGSGAMFIGEQTTSNGLGAATGGNTKLECTVNGSDNVCDVSVCDGFSLAMHCTGFGSGDIGGTQNLFDLGTCPDKNPNGPTCVNQNSHTSTSAAFFKNGGKYWYNDNDFVGTTFTGNPKVTCAISKGSGKKKRDTRMHRHRRGMHARDLTQLLAGSKL